MPGQPNPLSAPVRPLGSQSTQLHSEYVFQLRSQTQATVTVQPAREKFAYKAQMRFPQSGTVFTKPGQLVLEVQGQAGTRSTSWLMTQPL